MRLCCRHLRQLFRFRQMPNSLFVYDVAATGRDRAHGQLFPTGDPEFAHDENIQGQMQPGSYFVSDGDAAAWQRQYNHVMPVPMGL